MQFGNLYYGYDFIECSPNQNFDGYYGDGYPPDFTDGLSYCQIDCHGMLICYTYRDVPDYYHDTFPDNQEQMDWVLQTSEPFGTYLTFAARNTWPGQTRQNNVVYLRVRPV